VRVEAIPARTAASSAPFRILRRITTVHLRYSLIPGIASLAWLLWIAPGTAQAEVPSLQVAPLQYDSTLAPGKVSTGYVDVSNPADSTVTITSSVRGFRQAGRNGDLQFFDDADLSAAIQVGLTQFELGPREAVRVVFSVDAAKLPAGGTYAAIFFRTTPPMHASATSYVSQSANVGTLLMLTNGTGSTRHGKITDVKLGFWQFGDRLNGTFAYQNTDRTARPVGFRPRTTARVLPWGHRQKTTTGLVLPEATREFTFTRNGAFFGILPVTVADDDTKSHMTRWVFACTGWYQAAVPGGLLLVGLVLFLRRREHRAAKKQSL
jgi:hypothetical protein